MNQFSYYLDLAARYQESLGKTFLKEYLMGQKKEIDLCFNQGYILATYYVPSELMRLHNIPVLYCDRIAGFGSACGIKKQEFEIVENNNQCSYQLYLDLLLKERVLPLPEAIVALNYPCTGSFKYCNWLAEQYNIPIFNLKINRQNDRDNIIAVGEKLKELNSWLNKIRKQKKGIQKKIIEYSNQTMCYKKRIDELRTRYTGIINSQDIMNFYAVYNDFGTKTAKVSMKNLFKKIVHRTDYYTSTTEYKLLWLSTTPLHYNMIKHIENTYGCRFIYEDLFDYPAIYLDSGSFFYQLSERICETFYITLQNRIEKVIRTADEMEADGIVHFSQYNCDFLPPMYASLAMELERRRFPAIEIRGDGLRKGLVLDEGIFGEFLAKIKEQRNERDIHKRK